MSSRDDELLEILDDVFENGEEIPSRVTNRMLLAGIRKNYHTSSGNKEVIQAVDKKVDRNHEAVTVVFSGDKDNPGIFERLNLLETFKKSISKIIWLIAGAIVAGFATIIFGG